MCRLGGDFKAQGGNMKRKLFVFAVLFSIAAFCVPAESLLSGYDREIVATCMVLEAGGEGPEGMQAVLNVIFNRAGGYLQRVVPETVRYGAFSCMSSIWRKESPDYSQLIRRAENQSGAYQQAMQLITLMEDGFLRDNTGGATHYHAASISPYWVSGMRYLTTIGNHIFYIERTRQVALL